MKLVREGDQKQALQNQERFFEKTIVEICRSAYLVVAFGTGN
jgi:hypothetical protein